MPFCQHCRTSPLPPKNKKVDLQTGNICFFLFNQRLRWVMREFRPNDTNLIWESPPKVNAYKWVNMGIFGWEDLEGIRQIHFRDSAG